MAVEVVADVQTIITSVTALVIAAGGIAGTILTFLRTQKHSTATDIALEKASRIDGQVMEISKRIDADKEKYATVVDVSEKLVPALAEKHEQNKQKIDELKAQLDAIKTQLDRINALSVDKDTTTTPVPNA